jgi:hypothetical protein
MSYESWQKQNQMQNELIEKYTQIIAKIQRILQLERVEDKSAVAALTVELLKAKTTSDRLDNIQSENNLLTEQIKLKNKIT